jgi:hypothetical protein
VCEAKADQPAEALFDLIQSLSKDQVDRPISQPSSLLRQAQDEDASEAANPS